ncbi:MAG TPA: hypothetical protein VFB13_02720 [Reyranella sp.]|jgi:hypothetical protein|nr:hypothetical protein [Reyranella sp.]
MMRFIGTCLAMLTILCAGQTLAGEDCPSNSHADSIKGCVCNTGYMSKAGRCVLKRAQEDAPPAPPKEKEKER